MIISKFNILEFEHGVKRGSQKKCLESFCLAYENGHKKAQIHRPDLFPRASILENWSFCLAYENGQKKAQIRRPDLFPRASIWKGISFAVFTNFAATLARQPSAPSLAPRSKNYLSINWSWSIVIMS